MMRRFIAIIGFLILLTVSVKAQGLIRYNFGGEDLSLYNPAAASGGIMLGSEGTTVAVFSDYRFISSEYYAENPVDSQVHISSVTEKGTFSAGISYDGYSFFDSHILYGRYAGQMELSEGGILSIGGGLTIVEDEIHLEKLVWPEGRGTKSSVRPDLDFGVEYRKNGWNAGLAVRNLLSLQGKVQGYGFTRYPRCLIASLSRGFDLGNGWVNTDYLIGGYIQGLTGELIAKFTKDDRLFLSAGFRAMDTCVLFSAGAAFGRFAVGVSADVPSIHSFSTVGMMLSCKF